MQEMKPSMFSPIIPDSSAPFNPGMNQQLKSSIFNVFVSVTNGSPGVGSTEYYSSNPYTQYSNTYGVNYNYGAPSPGGLLTKWRIPYPSELFPVAYNHNVTSQLNDI